MYLVNLIRYSKTKYHFKCPLSFEEALVTIYILPNTYGDVCGFRLPSYVHKTHLTIGVQTLQTIQIKALVSMIQLYHRLLLFKPIVLQCELLLQGAMFLSILTMDSY